ncbi:putative dioxygenase [Sphaerochaeta pleomorpha str. Grapes]|uniref:Putative dioxygenase n=2 Tax=Sphaerochaeta TaxID=399320 RepID=G8QR45_SPHPG|nr:putative dioxygenase [Sphaerochaeta pleomorpha str. Grapes]
MHKSEHHAIFYPQDKDELEEACTKREPKKSLTKLPASILVPHASYDWSLDLLHDGFAGAQTLHPQLVVLLGSLHQEQLQGDLPCFIFAPSGDGVSIPTGKVLFPTELRDELTARFSDALSLQDSYFIEEPCIELTLPMIHSYFPQVPVLPFLMGNLDARQVRTLSALLSQIAEETKDVLFVVSANVTAILPSEIATEQARQFASLLKAGAPLLEEQRHGKVSSCGISALEALRGQTWGSSHWDFISFQCKDQKFDEVPDTFDEKDKIVWHCAALRGEA